MRPDSLCREHPAAPSAYYRRQTRRADPTRGISDAHRRGSDRKRVEEFATVCDPIHFAGNILPRPLLIIVAKHDELIPPEASQMLIDAAQIGNELRSLRRYATRFTLPGTSCRALCLLSSPNTTS